MDVRLNLNCITVINGKRNLYFEKKIWNIWYSTIKLSGLKGRENNYILGLVLIASKKNTNFWNIKCVLFKSIHQKDALIFLSSYRNKPKIHCRVSKIDGMCNIKAIFNFKSLLWKALIDAKKQHAVAYRFQICVRNVIYYFSLTRHFHVCLDHHTTVWN